MIPVRKSEPTKRTIVTEFKVTVADIHLRKKAMSGSIAKQVNMETDFIAGDAVVTPTGPFIIEDIRTAVMVHSFRSMNISLTIGGITTPPTECSGLFVFYGKIDRVVITTDGTSQRFSYIRS